LADIVAALADRGLFAGLRGDLAHRVLAKAELETLDNGAVLFRQGEAGDCLYLVVSGMLGVSVDIGAGPVSMAVLGPNQMVGEIAVFADQPRSATVTALDDCRLMRLDRDEVHAIIADTPEIGRALITDLGLRLTRVNKPLAFLSTAAQMLRQSQSDGSILKVLHERSGEMGAFENSFLEMMEELQAKQTQRQQLEMAARIQQSLLPRSLPLAAGDRFSIAATMRPAHAVGGDLYDYFRIGDRYLALLVADVSGKGVPASLFMVMFRSVLRGVAQPGLPPELVMQRVNAILAEDNEACMFVTAFLAILDLETGALACCNAGHNPPYRLGSEAGTVAPLPSDGGPAVGILDHYAYKGSQLRLEPGEGLFLYTDGITEAFAEDRAMFGEERLEALLAQLSDRSPQALVDATVAAVDDFAAGVEQSDDITCLVLRFLP